MDVMKSRYCKNPQIFPEKSAFRCFYLIFKNFLFENVYFRVATSFLDQKEFIFDEMQMIRVDFHQKCLFFKLFNCIQIFVWHYNFRLSAKMRFVSLKSPQLGRCSNLAFSNLSLHSRVIRKLHPVKIFLYFKIAI